MAGQQGRGSVQKGQRCGGAGADVSRGADLQVAVQLLEPKVAATGDRVEMAVAKMARRRRHAAGTRRARLRAGWSARGARGRRRRAAHVSCAALQLSQSCAIRPSCNRRALASIGSDAGVDGEPSAAHPARAAGGIWSAASKEGGGGPPGGRGEGRDEGGCVAICTSDAGCCPCERAIASASIASSSSSSSTVGAGAPPATAGGAGCAGGRGAGTVGRAGAGEGVDGSDWSELSPMTVSTSWLYVSAPTTRCVSAS